MESKANNCRLAGTVRNMYELGCSNNRSYSSYPLEMERERQALITLA